jgi:N-acetylglucosamine 6-phosphate deacetylase (EC 3.5.1.25)
MQLIGTSSGAIDLQINGALGLSFNAITAENCHRIPDICAMLWQMGIDAFLPTLVTTSLADLHRSMFYLSQFVGKTQPQSAQIIGLHLEGPFLNPNKRGAHPLAYLQELNLANVLALLEDYTGIVKVITLAPELDPTGKSIAYLVNQGIIVSLGHSQADQETTAIAIQQGATMVTHVFNAMPSLHHRQVNLLTEALLNKNIYCGAIADGVHVHPQMIELLLRLKSNKLFLVSDALAPLGLPEGVYPWDQRQIKIERGTARLPDGTLAGTTLPLWQSVLNLVRWGICDLTTAINTVTQTPCQILGITLPDSLQWFELAEGSYEYRRFVKT